MALELSRLLDNPKALPFNSLTNLVDLASTTGALFIVAPKDIKSEVYLFDTRGEEEANLESEITDNWIEDNSTMQDHIGLKPMTITLRGYVGELTNQAPKEFTQIKGVEIPSKLTGASFFAPTLTTQAQYVLNRAQEVYGIYQKANKSIGRIEEALKDIPVPEPSTKQAAAFAKFYELWQNRTLMTIYTPFGVRNNMAILSLNARQDETSSYISEFSVTFKQINIAGLISTYKDEEKQKSSQAAMTLATQKDKGVKKPNRSELVNIVNWLRG